MSNVRRRVLRFAIIGALTCSLATPSNAETGSVRVSFTKAGFIVGVGAGRGILTLRGRHYPFSISGLGVGFTIGASTNQLVGKAMNLRNPSDALRLFLLVRRRNKAETQVLPHGQTLHDPAFLRNIGEAEFITRMRRQAEHILASLR